MERAAKVVFFQELYALDNDESEENDSRNADAILGRNKRLAPSPQNGIATTHDRWAHAARLTQAYGSLVSTPKPEPGITPRDGPRLTSSISFSSVESSVTRKQHADEHPAKVTNPLGTDNMPKANGKRKRSQSFDARPEEQQIFKGMSFFFMPNDDVAAPRKLRIRRAMEFGALWVKEWRDGVTHIIADKNISYQDILKFLKITSLPAGVVLVDETYPGDCLRYRPIGVRPDPRNYRVNGHDTAPTPPLTINPEVSSGSSLPLKPGKGESTPVQHALSRTKSSEQHNLPKGQDTADGLNEYHSPEKPPSLIQECTQNLLDEAIEEAKAIQGLPLDLDEEDSPKKFDALDESEDERSEDEEKSKLMRNNDSCKRSWQEGFACMSKHPDKGESVNTNARTVEILQRMANYYEQAQDHWRFTAYRKAIGALRKQSSKITSAREAVAIPCIGPRLADKIEEIVWTDKLQRFENTKLEPNDEAFQLFVKIYGVGMNQASKWIEQGYRTITDLLNNAPLTQNQKIGIEHFDDFQTRIPRNEMDRHDQYVRRTCQAIDSTVQFTIGGSYRRGAPDSGDIDFIVTKPGCSIEVLRTIILETVIPRLFEKDYLKVGLAITARDEGSKWHGAAALPGTSIWRRIDFLLVPWEELGAALIYFTGNDIFNRSIRLLASKKGMRLNQRGLWKDVIRGENRARLTQGSLIESKDERKIFELLDVPWRSPHHRCVGN